MKCHEKPVLLLIWLKQVGHQDGDAQSCWQRWLRIVRLCSLLALWPLCGSGDRRGSPGLRALGEGGAAVRGLSSDNGVPVYCLGDVPCPCRLQEARPSPGRVRGRAGLLGGVSWGWVCE